VGSVETVETDRRSKNEKENQLGTKQQIKRTVRQR
jgi:hypothetical protein